MLKVRSFHFSSLFSYTPRPDLNAPNALEMENTKKWTTQFLKNDQMVNVRGLTGQIPMSSYVAKSLKNNLLSFPFSSSFSDETVLIPVPRSSQVPKGGLWVPKTLADAILSEGIGSHVITCLNRTNSIRKSAFSPPGQRPTPLEHYQSFSVNGVLGDFKNAILIDDVVTRGSTLIGAANILNKAFPNLQLEGFTAVRTISDPSFFKKWYDPVMGNITLDSSDNPSRVP